MAARWHRCSVCRACKPAVAQELTARAFGRRDLLEGLLSAVGNERTTYCSSCYTGRYPVPIPSDEARYLQLALKLDKDPAGKDIVTKEAVAK